MPKFVKVVWQPKSGGVVSRNQEQRAESRDARIKQYFYGPHNNLFPHSFEVDKGCNKKVGTNICSR